SPGYSRRFPTGTQRSSGKADRGETYYAALYICTTEKYKIAYLPSKTPQSSVKQHTVNPLITPVVNPFLPSVISTVSVLFISADH
ncbi:unnamed protein product, partial [Staurois parvus]